MTARYSLGVDIGGTFTDVVVYDQAQARQFSRKLLTTHDELLLRMLYDPRLKPGMTEAQATPVTRILAREYMGLAL